ncbi:class I SAM-dependent methyltransferase [Azorhizobium caulinodans]|uniref:class I SAM-dependent methyltransferase n=1 Tax=Azorhizobium caulinodans TaxID=7 RepID=UPI002FBED068
MTGFSADWLALREPADHRARNGDLAAALSARFGQTTPLRVTDIGAGTGSNLRATAPLLGREQHWTLVDYDPALLAEARRQLRAWADDASEADDGLRLTKDGRALHVRFREADLARAPEVIGAQTPHLVTASAFFDLVSADWIPRFADVVAQTGADFFTVLTCDGADDWQPPHPDDAAIAAGFHADQARDKGFGPAAGNDATALLAEAFGRLGYQARSAPSPWLLDGTSPADAALIAALAAGTAGAAAESGTVSPDGADAWAQARLGARSCRIGHLDLLATRG